MQRRSTVSLVALQCGGRVWVRGRRRRTRQASGIRSFLGLARIDGRARWCPRACGRRAGRQARRRRHASPDAALRERARLPAQPDSRGAERGQPRTARRRSTRTPTTAAATSSSTATSAPMSHFVDLEGVPAGKYELTVEVIGQSGTRAMRHLDFQVLGMSTTIRQLTPRRDAVLPGDSEAASGERPQRVDLGPFVFVGAGFSGPTTAFLRRDALAERHDADRVDVAIHRRRPSCRARSSACG